MTEFTNQDNEEDYVTNFTTEGDNETKVNIVEQKELIEETKAETKVVEETKVETKPTAKVVKNLNSISEPTNHEFSNEHIKKFLENEHIQKICANENVKKVISMIQKVDCRTNVQHGTLIGGFLMVLFFIFIRNCSFRFFFLISLIPISYAFFGSRTFSLGKIQGKVVLVTGASSGLGRGLALSAAKQGAKKVILVARSMNGLETTSKLISELNSSSEVVILPCDVTKADDVEKLADTCGDVNLLINCAGSGDWKPILDTTPAEAAANMACPYLAAFNVTRAFLPALIEAKGRGEPVHIMNVTSVAAFTAWRGSATYGSARWAIRGFSDYTRCEVKDHKIGVTLLNPGQIRGTEYAVNNSIDFDHLPWLFKKGYNNPRAYDCEMVASRALRGCTDGECEVHVPGLINHPLMWFTAYAPSVVWFVTDLKPFWIKDHKTDKEKKDN